jgi:hypothetical protein
MPSTDPVSDETIDVCGERTRVVCAVFSRRVFLSCTQALAFGAVLHCGAEARLAGGGGGGSADGEAGAYFVRGLLGCAPAGSDGDGDGSSSGLDDAPLLLGRRVAALVAADCGAACDVVLTLALAPRIRAAPPAAAAAAVHALLAHLERARPWRASGVAREAPVAEARPHYAATLRVGPGGRPLAADDA